MRGQRGTRELWFSIELQFGPVGSNLAQNCPSYESIEENLARGGLGRQSRDRRHLVALVRTGFFIPFRRNVFHAEHPCPNRHVDCRWPHILCTFKEINVAHDCERGGRRVVFEASRFFLEKWSEPYIFGGGRTENSTAK